MTSGRDFARAVNPKGHAEQEYRDHDKRKAWATEETTHWHCALVECITESRAFEWIADHYETLQLMIADDDGMWDRRERG